MKGEAPGGKEGTALGAESSGWWRKATQARLRPGGRREKPRHGQAGQTGDAVYVQGLSHAWKGNQIGTRTRGFQTPSPGESLSRVQILDLTLFLGNLNNHPTTSSVTSPFLGAGARGHGSHGAQPPIATDFFRVGPADVVSIRGQL